MLRVLVSFAVILAALIQFPSTALAQPQGDIWVSNCSEQSSGFVVMCDGFGGADIERLLPSVCEMGSRLGCNMTACQMLDYFTIRSPEGGTLGPEDLCPSNHTDTNVEQEEEQYMGLEEQSTDAAEEAQPKDNCSYHMSPTMCRLCVKGIATATTFCESVLK